MNISSLSNGFSLTAGNNTPRQTAPRDGEDPLTFLTEDDWHLVSNTVGFRVDPKGRLFPLLAFQIGWDRQSGMLHREQRVSISYLKSAAAQYSKAGSDGVNADLVAQINEAIRYLQSAQAPSAGLDICA